MSNLSDKLSKQHSNLGKYAIRLIISLVVYILLLAQSETNILLKGFVGAFIILNIVNLIITTVKINKLNGSIRDSYDTEFSDFSKKILNDFLKYRQQQRQHVHKANPNKLENAYKLLKLKKTDPIAKIKKTYRTLAIKWHPDKWTTSDGESQKIASRNFKKLQSAYDLIKKDKDIA